MATSSNTYQINVNATQAQQALTNLQSKVEGVNDVFGKLKTAIAGLAVGSFITNLASLSAAMVDVSEASGIALQSVAGFAQGVAQFGGSVQGAQTGLARFSNFIADAADGAKKNQDAFLTLGISLQELGTLSEEDLLRKSIDGLARMDDNSRRTALGMQIFGKSFATVNFRDLNQNLDDFIRKNADSARAMQAFDKAEESVGVAMVQLQMSLLKALQPLAELVTALLANKQAIQSFLDTVVSLAAAFALLYGASKVLGFITSLTQAFNRAQLASLALGTSMTSALIPQFGILKSAKEGWMLLTNVFTKFGVVTASGIVQQRSLVSIFGLLVGGIAKLLPLLGALTGAFILLNSAVEYFSGGTSIKDYIEQGVKALGFIKETSKERDAAADATKKQEQAQREINDAMDKERQTLNGIFEAYQRNNEAANKRFELETQNIRLSESQRQASQQLFEAEQKYAQERIKLQEKLDAAQNSTSPTDKAVIPQLQKALANLSDEYQKQISVINANVAAREQAIRVNNLELFGTRSLVENNKKLSDIQNQIANTGLPKLTQQTNAITQAMNASAEAAIAEEEARRKQNLDPTERQKYYDAARAGVDGLTEAQGKLNAKLDETRLKDFAIQSRINLENQEMKLIEELVNGPMSDLEKSQYAIMSAARDRAKASIDAYEAENGVAMSIEKQAEYYDAAFAGADRLRALQQRISDQNRSFSTGWNRAFKNYVSDATNAAKSAERLFNKAFQGIEDALVDFVKTGKFEWKNFVADMAEELLRSQIKQLLGGLGSALGLGSLGGGGAALGDSPNNPLYVMDIAGGGGGGFGNMFGGNNPMIPGGGIGGGRQQQGGGIFDGIGNIFGGITDTIGSVIGGVTDTIGSIFGGGGDSGGGFFDSITSLFDGWFANGGSIGAGKFGVVGENGPEFVGGPATVTPMAGSTNVTYNINAVDAASFKAMIARDPSFIHAVAMQGAKGIPGRY